MATDPFFASPGVAVEITELTKSYVTAAEEVHALRSVDFRIQAGEAVAIMGPSGCGKTTLLNLLGGVDRPTGGSILVDGRDLARADERDLEQYRLLKVGFVFQLFNLIPTMTAVENIELPMMVAGMDEASRVKRAEALLQMVGLNGGKGQKRPEMLSGGEQQRVAIALALANDPAIILADEPTGNLDTSNAAVITRLLLSLAGDHGKTVVMVSHDPKVVEQFPKVHSMRDGVFV